MTHPTSVNMTFDTSLVDVSMNHSFSTTESDPSEADTAAPPYLETPKLTQGSIDQTTPKPSPSQTKTATDIPKTSTPVQHIPTQEAYDQWANVYDTDGNMLQSIDDLELRTLLPDFLNRVYWNHPSSESPLNLLDLGCGTGRNTAKLLSNDISPTRKISVTGLDFSRGMLDIAATKLSSTSRATPNFNLRLEQCDCFPTANNPQASPLPEVSNLPPIDGLISTLVLEHVPLRDYFATLAALVTTGGFALVTNMHSEMGKMSQAGFVNKDGVKVRGESYAHSVRDTVAEAEKAGFEVLAVKERAVEKEDMEKGVVGERGWKWVGVKVWYGVLLRRVG